MRLLMMFPKWKWSRWNYCASLLVIVSIALQTRIEVEAVEYRTFDVGNSNSMPISMRSDHDTGTLVMTDTGRFSPRSGSMDIRSRYWSKTRRDPEYSEDHDTASDSYVTVNHDGEEINQDVCDTRPCIAFDRVDKEHTFTINMPRMEGRNHIFKKFVVQPVIQYVMQYDKNSEREQDTAASTNYEDYEGIQGQHRMRRKHEQGIDRFFNDVNARFEGYFGNDENGNNGGAQGGYGGGGGGGETFSGGNGNEYSGGGGGGEGGYSGSDGGYQSGGSNDNFNGGGGGINFNYGFGTGNGGGEYETTNKVNVDNQQQNLNGFASAGVYGPPGMTSAGPSSASGGSTSGYSDAGGNGAGGMMNGGGDINGGGMMNGGGDINGGGMMGGNAVNGVGIMDGGGVNGGGMSLSSAVQMSNPQQSSMQVSGMSGYSQGGNDGGNSMQTTMGMGGGPSTATTSASASGISNMVGMGQVGMSQGAPINGMAQASAVSGHGMGTMQKPPQMFQQMSSSSAASPPGSLYGVPGMTPGQPLGLMGFGSQHNRYHQGMSMANAGGSGILGMGAPQPMQITGSFVGVGMPGPVSSSAMASTVGGMGSISGGQMGGFNQQLMGMMGRLPGSGMISGAQNIQAPSGSNLATSNNGNFMNTGGANQMMGNGGGKGNFQNNVMQQSSGVGVTGQGGGSDGVSSGGSSTSAVSTSASASASSVGSASASGPSQEYGPPKEKDSGKGSSSSSSQSDSDDDGYQDSKERPSRPPRGKKPGGGSKPRGRGRGRGRKSLFSSLPSLPKIPASIGGHLSFMFSTGFGKNRKGRGGNGSGGGSKPREDGKSKPIDKEQVSDHILNILGLTVHHPPGHATNNASDYSSTNPIVLWEQQGNSTNLTQLASHLQEDTLEDIAAHLPLVEVSESIIPENFTEEFSTEKTEATISTTSEIPVTTTTVELEPTPTSPVLTAQMPPLIPTTVVKSVTLNQAIAIAHLFDVSSPPPPTDLPFTSSLPLLPTTTTTSSSPPPAPVFTTSPRPLTPPPPPKATRSRFRFRKPKKLAESPQSQLFPASLPVYLTPPPPSPNPTTAFPSQSLVTLPTPYDPIQEYINHNLSNNVITLDGLDIISSVTIPPTPDPVQRPKIEAYYAEADLLHNPIKLVEFDPWIYDALQAAFQPYDGNYFPGSPEIRKRRQSWDRNQRFNFLPSFNDMRRRNNLLQRNPSSLLTAESGTRNHKG